MIDYELAKKLKAAGFPQNDWMIPGEADMGGRNWPAPPTCGRHLVMDEPALEAGLGSENCKKRAAFCYKLDYLDSEEGKTLTVYIPTLSELIEACGEIHLWGPNNGGGWYADGGANTKQHGSTPEEAVANLWLAIHTSEGG